MRAAVLYFSAQGGVTARRVTMALLENGYGVELFAPEKYALKDAAVIHGSLRTFTGGLMDRDALVFIGACGIAVRSIAPYIKSKTVDPAVICLDEKGGFVISLLSGHIGGGNKLTAFLAKKLGAVPVITTATDVNGRFSVDAWAAENGFIIGSMAAAKRVSAAILEHDIPICADVPIKGALPAGLCGGGGDIGICVSVRKIKPFKDTLSIIPRTLTLGIGCKRDTPCEKIEAAVLETLDKNGLDFRAVRAVASIDLKANEPGLLEFCKKHALKASLYTAAELMCVVGSFTASEFVKEKTGADNVCERSAALGGNELIISKTARDGVTVAVAQAFWEVHFG